MQSRYHERMADHGWLYGKEGYRVGVFIEKIDFRTTYDFAERTIQYHVCPHLVRPIHPT